MLVVERVDSVKAASKLVRRRCHWTGIPSFVQGTQTAPLGPHQEAGFEKGALEAASCPFPAFLSLRIGADSKLCAI